MHRYPGMRVAGPVRPGVDLQATAFEAYHVVRADGTLVLETEDLFGDKAWWSWPVGRARLSSGYGKALIVAGQVFCQHLVGLDYVLGSGQSELGCQPVLEGAPQPLYSPSSLRRVGGYGGDAQVAHQAAQLGELPLARQLLRQGFWERGGR